MSKIIMTIGLVAVIGCNTSTNDSFLKRAEIEALPRVAEIEIIPGKSPKTQIIHVWSWHLSDRQTFEANGGHNYDHYLNEVESLQHDQEVLLRALRDRHGIDAVFLSGVTDISKYRESSDRLASGTQCPEAGLLDELTSLGRREASLRLGAVSRVQGIEPLKCENAEALKAADPMKTMFDSPEAERREAAIVQNILNSGHPVAIVILSGGHNLADNIDGRAEYVRIIVDHIKGK